MGVDSFRGLYVAHHYGQRRGEYEVEVQKLKIPQHNTSLETRKTVTPPIVSPDAVNVAEIK